MPDDLARFAANLRQARLQRELTQEALARDAGLTVGHVSLLERAQREPGLTTIAKLLRALDVPASVLFEGIDGA